MKQLLLIILLATLGWAGIGTPPYMYLDTDSPESAIFIHWKGGNGTIHYGIDNFCETASGTNVVHLTGLTKHAKYQWYLEVDGEKSEVGSFQLDPGVKGKGFRMAVFGDTQYMDKNVDSFFVYAAKQKPDLLIILGDCVTRDNTQYIGWGDNIDSLVVKNPTLFANAIWVPVMGNHDFQGSSESEWERDIRAHWMPYFPHLPATLNPDYSDYQQMGRNYAFDYGPITFTVNYGYARQGWTYQELETFWADFLSKKLSDDELKPMVIGLSHFDRERSQAQYFGPVYQDRRGVLWYNGHTHQHIRTKWRRISNDGSIESDYDTQQEGHMIYCHAGHPARESNMQKRMSIVDVTSDGMIYHKQYELADNAGKYDAFYPITDEFEVDGTKMVDEYCETHDCDQSDVISYTQPETEKRISLFAVGRRTISVQFTLESDDIKNRAVVEVLNIRGQRIAQLDGLQRLNGRDFKVNWNASKVTSGRYIIRVTSGTKVMTKQFNLL